MYELLVTEPEYLDSAGRTALEGMGHLTAKRMTRSELEQIIPNVDVIFVRTDTALDSKVLEKAKHLKIIASITTGLNHIDTAYAESHGIKVLHLHGAHTVSTAQYTITLMLSLCRNLPWAFDSIRQGRWERYKFIGTRLTDKTLGIVGIGRIGSLVASYAKALGLRVIAYDPYSKPGEIPLVNDLSELLAESDIISIHSVLTDETRGLIGTKEFEQMRDGVFLINAARAEIVDSAALLGALKSGKVAGAALDVFVHEPIAGLNDPLVEYARSHKNLLLTPHLGASTNDDAHTATLELAGEVKKTLDVLQSDKQ